MPTAVRLTALLGRTVCMARCCTEGLPFAMHGCRLACRAAAGSVRHPEATGAQPRGTFTTPVLNAAKSHPSALGGGSLNEAVGLTYAEGLVARQAVGVAAMPG